MKKHTAIKFSGKANYQITVQGRLDKRWSGQLRGMTITHESMEGRDDISTLLGEIPDQASLSGILNTLYDLHLAVISVEFVGVNPE